MAPNSSTLSEARSDARKSAMPSLLTESHPLCVCHKPLFDAGTSIAAFGERAETKRRHWSLHAEVHTPLPPCVAQGWLLNASVSSPETQEHKSAMRSSRAGPQRSTGHREQCHACADPHSAEKAPHGSLSNIFCGKESTEIK